MEKEKKKSKALPSFIILLGIGLIAYSLFLSFNGDSKNNNIGVRSSVRPDGTLLKDVRITGYMAFGNDYTFYIEKDGKEQDYILSSKNVEIFSKCYELKEYITVDVYYKSKGDKLYITGYDIYNKDTNEKIVVQSGPELFTSLGLYEEGEYTEDLVLKRIGLPGEHYNGDSLDYTFYSHVFTNTYGRDLVFKYIVHTGEEYKEDFFVPGVKYKVKFETKKDILDYENVILDIEKK